MAASSRLTGAMRLEAFAHKSLTPARRLGIAQRRKRLRKQLGITGWKKLHREKLEKKHESLTPALPVIQERNTPRRRGS